MSNVDPQARAAIAELQKTVKSLEKAVQALLQEKAEEAGTQRPKQ